MSLLNVIDGPPACYLTNLILSCKNHSSKNSNEPSKILPNISDSKLVYDSSVKAFSIESERGGDGNNVVVAAENNIQSESLHLWMVNFRRLLLNDEYVEKIYINGFHSRECLHSVAGLYDLSLPNMDLETTYASLTAENAITMLLYRSRQAVLEEIHNLTEEKNKKVKDNVNDRIAHIDKLLESDKFEIPKNEELNNTEEENTEKSENADVYRSVETENSDFYEIFSDQMSTSSEEADEEEEEENDEKNPKEKEESREGEEDAEEEEGDEEEEDEPDLSIGYNRFFRNSLLRKRKRLIDSRMVTMDDIGPENLLTGALTFEIKYQDHHRVLHLTFLAVRKPFQRRGIGHQLMELLKEIGRGCDARAIVVHADNSAIDFFKRQDFSDDYILNKQWTDFAEEYTNCILMTYLPAFSRDCVGVYSNGDCEYGLEIMRMEKEIEHWRRTSEQAHKKQLEAFLRLKNEVVSLKSKITSQDDMLKYLMRELRRVNDEKTRLENKLYFVMKTHEGENNTDLLLMDTPRFDIQTPAFLRENTNMEWITEDGKKTLNSETIEQIRNEFLRNIEGNLTKDQKVEIKQITPAKVSEVIVSTFKHTKNAAREGGYELTQRLYYHPKDRYSPPIEEILTQGFGVCYQQSADLMFTSKVKLSPTSKIGIVIVADVIVFRHAAGLVNETEEYPVRSPLHALPLALVEYLCII